MSEPETAAKDGKSRVSDFSERLKGLAARLFKHLGVPLIACGIAAGVAQTSWLQALENVYYDYWHVFAGVRYMPKHAAFVSVDDDTLSA